jgi:hypothetical protein
MVALIGRRRVGKTFLIKKAYENNFIFEITGLQNASTAEQLAHFHATLSQDAGFITGLDFFWNSFAVNKNLVVVLCGSSASAEIALNKEQAETLRRQLWTFAAATQTRKRLSLAFITTYSLTRNSTAADWWRRYRLWMGCF